MPDINNATDDLLNAAQDLDVQEFQAQVSPKLVQETPTDAAGGEAISGNAIARDVPNVRTKREVEPIAVTRLGGTLPWDTDSMQLQCGRTVTSSNGDMNIRLVMECIVDQAQFKKIKLMRASPDEIKLVGRAYTGSVTFDELKFDRIPDANGSVKVKGGKDYEPRYKVMLQSKEDEGV